MFDWGSTWAVTEKHTAELAQCYRKVFLWSYNIGIQETHSYARWCSASPGWNEKGCIGKSLHYLRVPVCGSTRWLNSSWAAGYGCHGNCYPSCFCLCVRRRSCASDECVSLRPLLTVVTDQVAAFLFAVMREVVWAHGGWRKGESRLLSLKSLISKPHSPITEWNVWVTPH